MGHGLGEQRHLESRLRQIATGFEAEVRLVHDSLIPTSAFTQDISAFEDLNCGTRLRIGCETLTGTWEALRDGRADMLAHTAIVVGDSARLLSERTVGLPTGQKRITVPSMTSKIAYQAAGIGHGFLPRASIQADLARGTLIELPCEESRPDETFWLAWKPGHMGEALKWWVTRLERQLVPHILPR